MGKNYWWLVTRRWGQKGILDFGVCDLISETHIGMSSKPPYPGNSLGYNLVSVDVESKETFTQTFSAHHCTP